MSNGIVRIDPSTEALEAEPTGVGTPAWSHEQSKTADGFTAGIWVAEAFDEPFPDGYPFDEFCTLLEGTVVLMDAAGTEHRFDAGDSFTIAKGSVLTWHQPTLVRKIYVIKE
jgi:uncharacterized cupin superfamily protein